MAAIGFGLVWGGWAIGFWGYCLIRGYNITFGQLVNPVHPYGSKKGEAWPPPLIPKGSLLPGKQQQASTAAAVQTA